MPGPGEWIIILLVVLILFGGRKIPQLAKDLGTGIREFRKSISTTAADEVEDHSKDMDNSPKKSTRKKSAKKS